MIAGFDFGRFVIGCGVWLAVSMVVGGFIATSTNLVGHFKPAGDDKRGPLDWLIWYAVGTATVFVSGQGVYWLIHFGVAIRNGALLPGSG